jgi:ABC-2 type transport system permease protein
MIRRIRTLARKEILHIRRDPRSLFLAIGQPAVLVIIFGFAISFDIRHVDTAVIDLDRTTVSRDLVARVEAADAFNVRVRSDDYGRAGRILDEGLAKIVLVIPPDFSRDIAAGRTVPLQILVDGCDSNTGLIAMGNMSRLVQGFASGILLERLGGSGTSAAPAAVPTADARVRVWYNPELTSANFIIPGLLAVIMAIMAAMLTSLTVAREWENGTMEQLMAGPGRPVEIVAGKLLPYFALGIVQVALIVLTGRFVFGVPFTGSFLGLIAASSAFLVYGLSLGLFFSIATRSQQLAFILSIILTLLPSFILSGFIFPIANMPFLLRLVSYLTPARFYLAALRGIFLKGYGFPLLWATIAGTAAFGAFFLILCVRKMRMRLDGGR